MTARRHVAACAVGLAFLADGAGAADWRSRISIVASDRVRYESVDWFGPPGVAPGTGDRVERYDFAAQQLRLGLRATLPNLQFLVEGQDVRLLGLPDDATLPPPSGSLGPGANYYLYNRETNPGATILRQAVLTVRARGANLALGRFEQADGLETLPADADLLWIKRARVAERLLGPFGYTHVGRTVDGARLWVDRPAWNATGLGVRPTTGGFEVDGGEDLDQVRVLGASLTAKTLLAPTPTDARAFWFHYEDERVDDGVPVRVDNRPLVDRRADRAPIRLHTAGGHAATVVDAGSVRLDGLAWLAVQRGDWGAQAHRAWGGALEAGIHWPRHPWSPWIRAGLNHASGDRDAGDERHGTFVPPLPTARVYALFPFYTAMNLEDRFVQLLVRPHPLVSIRADYHVLALDSAADLWYAGGGAVRQDIFGYGGTPSGGGRKLARVVDLSVGVTPHRRLALAAYGALAYGDAVVRSTFADEVAAYGFLEATIRY